MLIAALGAPLLAPVLLHVFHTQVDKSIEHRGDSPLARDLKTFWSWSRAQRAQHDENDEPYRIGYAMTDFHDHMVSISPVFNRTQLYKVGYTSAQQFRNFPMSADVPLLEALSVKFLVADHDLANPALVLEQTFGQLRVYRVASITRVTLSRSPARGRSIWCRSIPNASTCACAASHPAPASSCTSRSIPAGRRA